MSLVVACTRALLAVAFKHILLCCIHPFVFLLQQHPAANAPPHPQAEKVAGKFVARRIRPALQRAREKELVQVLSESTQYLKGLWARLNGGGGRRQRALPAALVQPPSSKKEIEKVCVWLGRVLLGVVG